MSAETVRSHASQQYFELRNELNRANKTKNQKTALEFLLCQNEEEYFIIIRSTGAEHGLRIAYMHKVALHRWILFENEMYIAFFKYMFLEVSRLSLEDKKNINIKLTNWLVRLWMS